VVAATEARPAHLEPVLTEGSGLTNAVFKCIEISQCDGTTRLAMGAAASSTPSEPDSEPRVSEDAVAEDAFEPSAEPTFPPDARAFQAVSAESPELAEEAPARSCEAAVELSRDKHDEAAELCPAVSAELPELAEGAPARSCEAAAELSRDKHDEAADLCPATETAMQEGESNAHNDGVRREELAEVYAELKVAHDMLEALEEASMSVPILTSECVASRLAIWKTMMPLFQRCRELETQLGLASGPCEHSTQASRT